MARAPRRACKVDVVVRSALWNQQRAIKSLVRRAVAAAAAALSTSGAELAIVLSDDSAIRELNRDWCGIDGATNVLSFPAGNASGQKRHIGDIVLAYETVAREARAERKPFAHHVAHLAVHGYLHLLGYNHQDVKNAEVMERLEGEILRRLTIPDPYRPRSGVRKRSARSGTRPR